MSSNLKKFLFRSVLVLLFIHLAYFIYGYIHFNGVKNINIYTEFYRFKFYDEVSISHFFVTGLYLLVVLILLIRNHSKVRYSAKTLLSLGSILLFIVCLSLSFFISYSFGMNARLKTELPEKTFNADKSLLNVLNPFLYPQGAYNSEKLFKITNILYPKPYPVMEQQDTLYYDQNNPESLNLHTVYYGIDTLKLLTSNYEKLKKSADAVTDVLGFGKAELAKRTISIKSIKDSTEIIYKGQEVNPQYDETVCIFLENNNLISAINGLNIKDQERQNAVKRYQLLYAAKPDSLLLAIKQLDTLLKKYHVESAIKPEELTKDAIRIRNQEQQALDEIRNSFDRNKLVEQITTLDRLFYKPNFFHPSIRMIFVCVLFATWIFGFLIFLLANYKRKPKL